MAKTKLQKKVTYKDLFKVPEDVIKNTMESGIDIRRLYCDVVKYIDEDVLLYDLTGKGNASWKDVRPDQVEYFIKTTIEEIVDHLEKLEADGVKEEDMYYTIDPDRTLGFQSVRFYFVDYKIKSENK